jgi:hypothetical protein
MSKPLLVIAWILNGCALFGLLVVLAILAVAEVEAPVLVAGAVAAAVPALAMVVSMVVERGAAASPMRHAVAQAIAWGPILLGTLALSVALVAGFAWLAHVAPDLPR